MNNKKIILIKNFNLINNNRNFVFSALNLSFLSFLCKGIIKNQIIIIYGAMVLLENLYTM